MARPTRAAPQQISRQRMRIWALKRQAKIAKQTLKLRGQVSAIKA